MRQSFFDKLRRVGLFEQLQSLAWRRDSSLALAAAERSRGRDLLDLLEQQHADPVQEAELRATRRGHTAAAQRLRQLRQDLVAREAEVDRLLHAIARLADGRRPDTERQALRKPLFLESNAACARRHQLLDVLASQAADARAELHAVGR